MLASVLNEYAVHFWRFNENFACYTKYSYFEAVQDTNYLLSIRRDYKNKIISSLYDGHTIRFQNGILVLTEQPCDVLFEWKHYCVFSSNRATMWCTVWLETLLCIQFEIPIQFIQCFGTLQASEWVKMTINLFVLFCWKKPILKYCYCFMQELKSCLSLTWEMPLDLLY